VTRLAAALIVVAGCRCGARTASPQPSPPAPVVPTVGSAIVPSSRLAVLMVGGVTVCDLVSLDEVAAASGLRLDEAFPRNGPSSAACVYQNGSDNATSASIAIVSELDLTAVEHGHPGGAPLPGIAKDNWYVDQADDDTSVLYVQDGSEQLTVAVDNGLPADRRPAIAEKLAQLALTRR
jgi:hypothetical protein